MRLKLASKKKQTKRFRTPSGVVRKSAPHAHYFKKVTKKKLIGA